MEVEIDLVYKAIDGDQDAFGSLIKTYYEEIYQIAFGITGSPLDAEDLAQETFIKAYTSISQLRNPDRFKIWLRKIAQNICMDWLRSNMQQNLPIDDLSNDTQLTFPSADERLIREDFEEALTLALSSLSKEDVGILRLFYIYGFDYSQIMRVSGLSYSALTSRLHRIRKRIKTITGDYILTTKAESAFTILSGGAKYMKIGLGFSDSVLSTIRTVEYAQPTETDRQFLCGISFIFLCPLLCGAIQSQHILDDMCNWSLLCNRYSEKIFMLLVCHHQVTRRPFVGTHFQLWHTVTSSLCSTLPIRPSR